jgi:hypothetical protein
MAKEHPLVSALTDKEIFAIKNVYFGIAEKEAQTLAITTILKKICNIGSISHNPENPNPHNTAFNEGHRSVGKVILDIIEKENTDDRNNPARHSTRVRTSRAK